MADDTRLFHGRKFSLGYSQLVRVQVAGFGKNRRARVSKKMVENRMTRWRGSETIGGEDIRKL